MSPASRTGDVWPKGARAAIALTLDNMGEAADIERDLWPSDKPIGSHFSVVEVIPKILTLLERYNVNVTYFVEAWNLSVYADTISAIARAGHEIAWHGWQHESWARLDAQAEEENFDRSFGEGGLEGLLRKIEHHPSGGKKVTGGLYRGFRPPGGVIDEARTLKLCGERGLSYISPAAQEAALVKTGHDEDKIAVLPFRWTTVDATYYMDAFGKLRPLKGFPSKDPVPPAELAQKYIEQIDETIETGGFLSLLFHPFLTTSSDRMAAMETVTKYLAEKRDEGAIWLAKCQDIATYLHEHPGTVGEYPTWDRTTWR
ncbi:carbohydrate esterase family 4 protein [Xylariaceae sp. FL0594]|nr:carbohydrate esterase family 4 protein [Xylariaceae sp. FL0594]